MPDNATVEISGVRMNLAMNQKEFKTGSRGYFAQGKFEVNGKRYQVQVQAVEIGSKERNTA